MSVSGIGSSNFFNTNTQNTQNKFQQFQQEFQQLGQDLNAGNLSAAQSDFATLQQLGPQNNANAAQGSNPIGQAFSQLSQALQSGNLSAAQQDYNTLQQDFQNQSGQAHHHHHHHGGNGGGGTQGNPIGQLFSQLGQALQSGNLSGAQQAYSTLQQDFQQFIQNGATGSQAGSQTTSNGISVNA